MTPQLNKKTILFVSYSESESSFLVRVAKPMLESDQWKCYFLLLHNADNCGHLIDELNSFNTPFKSMQELEFYDCYGEKSFVPKFNDVATVQKDNSIKLNSHNRILKFYKSYNPNLRTKIQKIEDKLRAQYRDLNLYKSELQRGQNLKLQLLTSISRLYRIYLQTAHQIRYLKPNTVRVAKKTMMKLSPRLYTSIRNRHRYTKHILSYLPFYNSRFTAAKKRSEVARLKRYISSSTNFIRDTKISVLVLAKDSAYYSTVAFVQAAKVSGIPSVVIPYDRADSATLAKDRLGHPDHQIRLAESRQVASKHPNWVFIYKNEALLLSSPATVLAIEHLQLAPENPWLYNSSRCDRIFVETQEDKQLFMNDGAKADQLVVIGAPYMDKIDEVKRHRKVHKEKLSEKYNLDITKPFVIASVPPNKLTQCTTKIEFSSYRELMEKWSGAMLRHLDCNLIYSLHPLTNRNEVAFIETTGGFIIREPLEELLAIADLYIVDCSGTTRWARYAGVDVIDFDVYRYNLWFNSKMDGVLHIETYDEFNKALIAANAKIHGGNQTNNSNPAKEESISNKFSDRLSNELMQLISN
jgi:hypothetical protein